MESILANCAWSSARARNCDLFGRRTGRIFGAAALAAILLAGLTSIVSAQQYQADEVDEKIYNRLNGVVLSCVKDPAKYTSEQADFNEYFTKYYFPAMTRYDEEELGKLGARRYDLFQRFLWATQNDQLQKDLTELAFDKMKSIAGNPKYHPAVRYNAVLVIGMLDAQYGSDSSSSKRPPKPLEKANRLLTQIVGLGIQGNPVVTPSLVVGALVGLERHAQYHESLKPAQIDAMTEAAITLATKDPPLADVDGKVAEWIRIEAATVLAKLGSVGTNNRVHDALVALLADNKISLDGRCGVAGMLGQLNYKDVKVDGKAASEKLLQLALEVGQACDKQANAYQEMSLGGGAGGTMGRERGGRGTYSSSGEPHNDYDRKTLLSQLGDLRKGLVVAKPIAPADRAAAIDSVTSAMQTV
ncbi:MAG TPA: hypothetical protein VGJ26_02620, partial [Pirellulales bacterium]